MASGDGQKFYDAAKRMDSLPLRDAFHLTGGFIGPRDEVLKNLSLAGNTSIILNINMPEDVLEKRQGEEKSEKKKNEQFWNLIWIQEAIKEQSKALEELSERYNTMARWHRERAEEQHQAMERALNEMAYWSKNKDELDELLNNCRLGKFDRERIKQALQKAGLEIRDNASHEELQRLLEIARADAYEKEQQANKAYEAASSKHAEEIGEAEKWERKAKEILEKRDEIIRNGGETPETVKALKKHYEENERAIKEAQQKVENEELKSKMEDLTLENQMSPKPENKRALKLQI